MGHSSRRMYSDKMQVRRLMPHGTLWELTVSLPLVFSQVPSSHEKQFFFLDRGIRIPTDDAAEADITKDQVKIQEKYGGGYVANVEGLHHLQCLVITFICSFDSIITNTNNRISSASLYTTTMTTTTPNARECSPTMTT
jgi:hypothetical protein